jgi:hypothetical protein
MRWPSLDRTVRQSGERRRPRQGPRRQPPFRPKVEGLEARLVPSTLYFPDQATCFYQSSTYNQVSVTWTPNPDQSIAITLRDSVENILITGPGSAGFSGSGTQTVTGPALNLRNLTFTNPPSYTSLVVDHSQVHSGSATMTLSSFTPPGDTAFGAISGLVYGAQVHYRYADTRDVTLKTAFDFPGPLDIDVLATGPGVTTNLENTGLHPGHVWVGTLGTGDNGRLTDILGPVNVFGAYYDLFVVDSGDDVARTVTLSDDADNSLMGMVSFGGVPPIRYEYAGMEDLIVETGRAGGNVVNVLATGCETWVYGFGFGSVYVGNAGSLADLRAPLTMHNRFGTRNTLTVDDSAEQVGRGHTESEFVAPAEDEDPPDSNLMGRIAFDGLAPINYEYDDTSSVTVLTDPGADTQVHILATGVPVNLINHGPTTVTVGDAGGLANILGELTISNPTDYTTVIVDDSADPEPRDIQVSNAGITGLAPTVIHTVASDTGAVLITTGGGPTTAHVISTPVRGVRLALGGGDDTVYVGDGNGSLDYIRGPLTVDGAGGTNVLVVNDQGTRWPEEYDLDQATIVRRPTDGGIADATIAYSSFAAVTLYGGYGNNGGIDHIFQVAATPAGTAVSLYGGPGSTDEFVVGYPMNGIQGPLALHGAGPVSFALFNDSADPVGQTFTLTAQRLERSGMAAIGFDGLVEVVLYTGTGSDTVNVQSVAAGVFTPIAAGTGDSVIVGSQAPALGGTLANILGPVRFEGTGVRVVVDDSGDPVGRQATFTPSGIDVDLTGLTPADIIFALGAGSASTVLAGTGNDTFGVQATQAGVPLTIDLGAGDDAVHVGDATHPLDAILGPLAVQGQAGSNTLTIEDQATASAQTYTLTGTTLTRSGAAPVSFSGMATTGVQGGSGGNRFVLALPLPTTAVTLTGGSGTNTLTGANASNTWTIATANGGTLGGLVTFAAMQNLTGGTGPDTFQLTGTGSISGNLTGGGGADELDYSADGGQASTVNLQTHTASRVGGTWSGITSLKGSSATGDTLIGPNAVTTWQITGTNAGNAGSFTFTATELVRGGTARDTFQLSPAGTVLALDGGGGGDWLDYTAFSTPVTVSLASGSAGNVNGGSAGAVSQVQNVRGGSGGNTLTGNAQGNILIGGAGSDVLQGGSGRSILIGGGGSDQLTGGSGDDILIGGTTSYDSFTAAHDASLAAILAEWQRTDKNFDERITHLKNGGGYNGPDKLLWGTTVFDDASADRLTGGLGRDWFFANLAGGTPDTITDLNKGGPGQIN